MCGATILRLALLLVLIAVGLGLGDLSLPNNSNIMAVGDYSVGWCITPRNTIILGINQSSFGYFAISYQPSMSNVMIG